MTPASAASFDRTAYESGQWIEGESLRPGGLELTARAVSLCRLPQSARVLDLGCGSGASASYLHKKLGVHAVCIDISPSACQLAQQAVGRWVTQGSGLKLPFAAGSMDAVLAECSLSLTKNQAKVLGECRRVLKSHGKLVITDLYPRNPAPMAALHALPGNCISGLTDCQVLETMLGEHGLRIELWEDHSEDLKQLLLRFVLKHGSLDQLWASKASTKQDVSGMGRALREARAGYFLLIATKASETANWEGEPQ